MKPPALRVARAARIRPALPLAAAALGVCLLLLAAPAGASPPTVAVDADLAPISLGEHDGVAREYIVRGKWREAANTITARAPEARMVLGWLREKAGDPRMAIAALEGLEAQLPLLSDLIRLTRGRALLDLERFAEAAAAVEGVDPTTRTGRMARRIRARALREGGQTDAARALYQQMVVSGIDDEVAVGLLGQGRILVDAGEAARAIPLFRRIDVEFPADWTARHARREAEALVKANRKLKKAWSGRSVEEEIARAERLLARHQNQRVIDALTPLNKAKLEGEQLCRQRYALGRALRKRRKWKTARPLLEEAVKACDAAGHALAPWARHIAGKAAERLAFEEEAADHYRVQMEKHPEHRLADDGGYYVVRHLVDDQKDVAAARALLGELVERFPAGDMMPDAVFFVAQQYMLQGEWKAAGEVLTLDDRLDPQGFDHRSAGRTLYWRARIAQKTGDRAAALEGYRATLSTWPLSWYAILAYSRLRELGRKRADRWAREALSTVEPGPSLPAGESERWALAVPTDAIGPAWERARLLARMGLADEARAAFAESGLDARPDGQWLEAWVLDRAGAYTFSHDILRRRLAFFRRFAPHGTLLKHWKLAFPNPFERLVKAAAKDAGIDHHFVWGVIREESGFNARVSSWANAVGLMQLILPTAKRMAKKSEGRITKARLTDPDLNVKLGARYLAHVGDTNRAVMPLWPAGYNAGGGALKRWLKARGHLDLDLFVETIPFEEARGYTKRVVSSWATFRLLYGSPESPLPYIGQKTRVPKKIKKKKSRKKKRRKGRKKT